MTVSCAMAGSKLIEADFKEYSRAMMPRTYMQVCTVYMCDVLRARPEA